jgi:hypothetical protein
MSSFIMSCVELSRRAELLGQTRVHHYVTFPFANDSPFRWRARSLSHPPQPSLCFPFVPGCVAVGTLTGCACHPAQLAAHLSKSPKNRRSERCTADKYPVTDRGRLPIFPDGKPSNGLPRGAQQACPTQLTPQFEISKLHISHISNAGRNELRLAHTTRTWLLPGVPFARCSFSFRFSSSCRI